MNRSSQALQPCEHLFPFPPSVPWSRRCFLLLPPRIASHQRARVALRVLLGHAPSTRVGPVTRSVDSLHDVWHVMPNERTRTHLCNFVASKFIYRNDIDRQNHVSWYNLFVMCDVARPRCDKTEVSRPAIDNQPSLCNCQTAICPSVGHSTAALMSASRASKRPPVPTHTRQRQRQRSQAPEAAKRHTVPSTTRAPWPEER